MPWLRLLGFACAVSAAVASAHELEHADAGVGTAEPPSPAASGETTVRERRPARSASEVTLSQAVVNAAPRTSAVDLLRLVPGLVASQHSGEGKAQQLFLRGFDAVHGQDVELNVAGLPVNEVSHVHALGYADLNWLIAEAVREVRVTEGSYRAAQGDFAVAGTVRYELGLEERGVTVAGSLGSFNRARLFAGVRPFASKETFAAVELVRGDGFGPQRAFGRVSALGQAVVPLEGLTLRAVVGSASGRFESPGVVREELLLAGRAGFFDALGRHQGGSSSRHQLLLGVEVPHGAAKTSAEVFGALTDLELRNNFTGFRTGADGDGLDQRHANALLGVRVEHHRHLTLFGGEALSLDLGLGARRDALRQSQRPYADADAARGPPSFDAQVTQSAASTWVEAALAPGAWRLMLGTRVDAVGYEVVDALGVSARRSAFGARVGLKAGVERRLGRHLTLHANYGDGFRSAQARSLTDGEVAPFITVRGAELGGALAFSKVVTRLALFGAFVGNDVFFDHTVGTTVNLGPSWRAGASLVVTAAPVAGWDVSGSVTAATAQVATTGALLPYFAPLVARLDTGYAHGFALFGEGLVARVGTGLTFIGPRPLPLGVSSRAVFLADVRASLRWRAVEVVLDAQNLFDSQWRDGEFVYPSTWEPGRVTSLLPTRHVTAGSPRTLLVTVELHL